MDAAAWDARYTGSDLVWGAAPNQFVAAELGELPPGRIIDLACGEGRNAVWLATRGWRATGVDFSTAAVLRADRLAADAGVTDRVTFALGDVVDGPLPTGPFDAVVVAYLQLPAPRRRTALRRAAGLLAAGGTMLIVAHDTDNITHRVGGPQDPAVLYAPNDVTNDLADRPDLVVEKAEQVHRPVPGPDGERTAIDVLVRVRVRRAIS